VVTQSTRAKKFSVSRRCRETVGFPFIIRQQLCHCLTPRQEKKKKERGQNRPRNFFFSSRSCGEVQREGSGGAIIHPQGRGGGGGEGESGARMRGSLVALAARSGWVFRAHYQNKLIRCRSMEE